MKAIDTNVLLRLIVGDDPKQEVAARTLIEAGPVLISLTVAMESEWVLRSYYKLTPVQIAVALNNLTDVANLNFEHVEGLYWALERLREGADFADMIHLIQARILDATSFVTFDADLEDEAGNDPPVAVETIV